MSVPDALDGSSAGIAMCSAIGVVMFDRPRCCKGKSDLKRR